MQTGCAWCWLSAIDNSRDGPRGEHRNASAPCKCKQSALVQARSKATRHLRASHCLCVKTCSAPAFHRGHVSIGPHQRLPRSLAATPQQLPAPRCRATAGQSPKRRCCCAGTAHAPQARCRRHVPPRLCRRRQARLQVLRQQGEGLCCSSRHAGYGGDVGLGYGWCRRGVGHRGRAAQRPRRRAAHAGGSARKQRAAPARRGIPAPRPGRASGEVPARYVWTPAAVHPPRPTPHALPRGGCDAQSLKHHRIQYLFATVMRAFAEAGMFAYSMDAHGHGRSEPLDENSRAFVADYKHLVGLSRPTPPPGGGGSSTCTLDKRCKKSRNMHALRCYS